MSRNTISNIIFELGGVFLDLDMEKTIRAFTEIGFTREMIKQEYTDHKTLWKFEIGGINPDQFRQGIRDRLNKNIPDEKIDKAWNAMILGFQETKIIILKNLKSKYRTFLLSNTNILHEKIYSRILKEEFGINGMRDLFEKFYYSHILGMAKPDPEIFKYVLNDSNLIPEETLYVDDSEQHISVARKFGIRCFLFPRNGDLNEVIKYLN